ncbi:FMN-binding protein [Paractinoplanes durhamensis]|uniref:FMN-binding protein n=1 Tax=Paractinoplanes durhamensis TaxID=113563 RepID=A0ABQ3YS84_9ACTN|nr:FMN-binding protein [Actinoplanes durhamensis]GIE00239.1 FMN-binding protein [Actinoplanes durhamensis]
MRRISLWLFSTVAAVVLLFSYRTSTNSTTAAGSAQTTISRQATTPTPTGTSPSPGSSTSSTSSSSSAAKTYTGSVVSTRWGDVQVAITVVDGKITDVAVPIYPSENGKDQEINAYALPILRQETLAAQSANIDTVSGATVTSNGYLGSLQAALDAAHLS